MNLAGLKLVMPSTPYDAKGLMKSAIRDNNPVVFFEDQMLAQRGVKGPVPEEEYTIPIGVADVKRQGRDVTVVAIAKTVPEALAAAEELASEGIAVEVVDPRTLVPLDKGVARLRPKPGVWSSSMRLVSPAAPPLRSPRYSRKTRHVPGLESSTQARLRPRRAHPHSPVMERFCLPDKARIIAGIREVLV